MSGCFHTLPAAACCLWLTTAVAYSASDLVVDIDLAVETREISVRTCTAERILRERGAADALVRQLQSGTGKRRAKVAVLLGAAADTDVLAGLLHSQELAKAGSLVREILAMAYFEKLLASPSSPVSQVLSVVDALYADPNWRIRQIAARLLRVIDSSEPTVALQALSQDVAWPVRSHAIHTPVPFPEKDSDKAQKDKAREGEAPMERLPRALDEAARGLSMIDGLYGTDAPAYLMPSEHFEYSVHAKWGILPLPSGTLQVTITNALRHGVSCYHIHQRIDVAGRFQEEDAYIDAEGLFPYEYRIDMHRPIGGRLRHVVLWDPVGGKIFLSKIKREGDPRNEAWKMGEDEPSDSRDPLSAMLLYRRMVGSATHAVSWSANVLMSGDERYHLCVTAEGAGEGGGVFFKWNARDCDETDRTVEAWFGPAPSAVPMKYITHAWGVTGTAELTKHTVVEADAPSVPHP